MSQNPYIAPASNVSEVSSDPIRVYSPGQVGGGVFLGGPVALVYFLRANFAALGDDRLTKATLYYGVLFVIAAFGVAFILPDNIPSLPINIAYMVMARQLAEKYQLSKETIAGDPRYRFHSNWRVVGFALLCVAGSLGVLVVGYLILHALGLIA